MERALATVCLVSKEIHTIKIEAVVVNVKSMMIVMIVWHASHTNVLIHVLEFAAIWPYVMYPDIILHAGNKKSELIKVTILQKLCSKMVKLPKKL